MSYSGEEQQAYLALPDMPDFSRGRSAEEADRTEVFRDELSFLASDMPHSALVEETGARALVCVLADYAKRPSHGVMCPYYVEETGIRYRISTRIIDDDLDRSVLLTLVQPALGNESLAFTMSHDEWAALLSNARRLEALHDLEFMISKGMSAIGRKLLGIEPNNIQGFAFLDDYVKGRIIDENYSRPKGSRISDYFSEYKDSLDELRQSMSPIFPEVEPAECLEVIHYILGQVERHPEVVADLIFEPDGLDRDAFLMADRELDGRMILRNIRLALEHEGGL